MGWTSHQYKEETHLEWTSELAKEFSLEKFHKDGYEIIKFWFHKPISFEEHNELYLVMNHPNNYHFLMVVLVDIIDEEIFWKEMPISIGPCYYNCPKHFLETLPEPSNNFERNWRNQL